MEEIEVLKISLAAARKNANLTQQQVADTIKVAVSTVRNWETGKTTPTVAQAFALCAIYGVAFDNIEFVA